MATADKIFRFMVSVNTAAIPANTVQLIGTGSEQTVGARPAGFSAGQWTAAVFYQYCGGVFVPGWGAKGCWLAAGHGGHAASNSNMVDACIFDFDDQRWKWLPNTNGITNNPTTWTEAQTDGSPYYALTGSSGQVPPPSHTYRINVGVGSDLIAPWRQYGLESGNAGGGTWRCRLNYAAQTCTWSRIADTSASDWWGTWTNSGQEWSVSHYDSARGLVWAHAPTLVQSQSIGALNPSTGVWTASTMTGLPGTSAQQNGSDRGQPIMDVGRSRIWYVGANNVLYYLPLGTPGASIPWQIAGGATGIAESARSGTSAADDRSRWHEYPLADGGDGCFYTHAHAGQPVLKRFNPTTLVFDTVTIAQGDAMPSWNTAYPGHYSNFIYVPADKCFAFVPGNNQRVALVRP